MKYAIQPDTSRCPQKISLDSITLDPRRAYIDDVLAILNESRFGSGRRFQLITRLATDPESRHTVFMDATPQGPLPSYSIWETTYRRHIAMVEELMIRRLAEQGRLEGIIDKAFRSLSPTTLARGSPTQPSA